MIEGNWLGVQRTDPRAFGLYRRHYSYKKNCPMAHTGQHERHGLRPDDGPTFSAGRCVVRLAPQHGRAPRQTGRRQLRGRNEGACLSSDLIREADDLAWQRWTDEPRHFTYVDPSEIRHKRDPGRCFIKAGWRKCGVSANGKLLFERVAPA